LNYLALRSPFLLRGFLRVFLRGFLCVGRIFDCWHADADTEVVGINNVTMHGL
jgi:hypothetical protein